MPPNEAADRLRLRVLQGSEDENALLDAALATERRNPDRLLKDIVHAEYPADLARAMEAAHRYVGTLPLDEPRTATRPFGVCDECWHDRHIVFRLPNPDCEACRG